jgi:hypothetical protein
MNNEEQTTIDTTATSVAAKPVTVYLNGFPENPYTFDDIAGIDETRGFLILVRPNGKQVIFMRESVAYAEVG